MERNEESTHGNQNRKVGQKKGILWERDKSRSKGKNLF